MSNQVISFIFVRALFVITMGLLSACSVNDPKKEDTPELITKVILTFTSGSEESPIVVTATDPDGIGLKDTKPDGPVNLVKGKTYILSIQLINGFLQTDEEGYDLTEDVAINGDEHQFFFAWSNNIFSDPAGDGNVDNDKDALNYMGGIDSKDKNGRPLGLITTWTAASAKASGSFQILLKHQPDLKSDTSDSSTGETDLDISFTINVD